MIIIFFNFLSFPKLKCYSKPKKYTDINKLHKEKNLNARFASRCFTNVVHLSS